MHHNQAHKCLRIPCIQLAINRNEENGGQEVWPGYWNRGSRWITDGSLQARARIHLRGQASGLEARLGPPGTGLHRCQSWGSFWQFHWRTRRRAASRRRSWRRYGKWSQRQCGRLKQERPQHQRCQHWLHQARPEAEQAGRIAAWVGEGVWELDEGCWLRAQRRQSRGRCQRARVIFEAIRIINCLS